MRKRIIITLCLVLTFLTTAIPAIAAGSVNAWLSADSTSVNVGSTVTITVSAEVDSCGAASVEIFFDGSVFELIDGECIVNGNTPVNYFDVSAQEGGFSFDYGETKPISGGVFRFTLRVKNNSSSGNHQISVSFAADGTSVSRSISITVACDHTYDNGCDETCNRCGGTRTVSHKYDSGKITTAATCSKEGVKTYTCSSCGKTKTETVSKTDHSWDSGKVTKEATCTEEGEKRYTCSACGTTKTEATDTLSHNYEVIAYTEATCVEDGEIVYECVDCGYTYDDYIEADGHSYDDDCDEECNTCGEIREVEHIYAEEDEEPTWLCDKQGHWQECQNCGKAQEPIPHTPGPAATETEDQVCLECGFVIKAAIAHSHKASGNFLGDDDKHWFLCACGELMGENDHRWEDKGIEDGQQIFKCIICSRVRTEPVETTAPTEETTAPTTVQTQPSTEATVPNAEPDNHVGVKLDWRWVVPVALIVLIILSVGIYIIVGLILAYRKPGKYNAKKKK